jgi:hypothetical protein
MAGRRRSGFTTDGLRQGVDQMRSFAPLRMTNDGRTDVETVVSVLGMPGRAEPRQLLQQDAAGRGISVRVLSRRGIAGNCDIAIC